MPTPDPGAEPPATVQLDLPADATAPGAARAQTRRTLRAWGLPGLLDPLLLAVSELVGNAVRHGRPPFAVRLRRRGQGVRLEVHDEASREPRPAATLPGAEAESGRGLFLVEQVSSATGVEDIPGDGTTAWATFEPEERP
ncbi:MAG: signal transduction histidine kinase regulating citrate/malate metabolism [Frankiales bacterium]|jgi:anti-sigma regulatory factor (Ser/Thr protein kinase)|nr:signal transduction histidine kinase regulating citrate/malate metabolism [Frankiales bacterium]